MSPPESAGSGTADTTGSITVEASQPSSQVASLIGVALDGIAVFAAMLPFATAFSALVVYIVLPRDVPLPMSPAWFAASYLIAAAVLWFPARWVTKRLLLRTTWLLVVLGLAATAAGIAYLCSSLPFSGMYVAWAVLGPLMIAAGLLRSRGAL